MKTDHWDVVMLLLGSLVDDVKVVQSKVNEDFILFFFTNIRVTDEVGLSQKIN